MIIFTLNCGSSSAKYQAYDWEKKEILGVGLVERIGQESSCITHVSKNKDDKYIEKRKCLDHTAAIAWIMNILMHKDHGCIKHKEDVKAVGHRVVHGGEVFTKSVLVDSSVLRGIEECIPLAPLHNPANLAGIRSAMEVLPKSDHCAILDTAWHQTMPEYSYMYALPYNWYEQYKVRRYGFHGTSYIYTAKRASVLLGKQPENTNLIIAHIGNGSSICAVRNGRSVDTSMGMTPLEGLVMGTRCGDIDPAIVGYMMNAGHMNMQEMDTMLNKQSGVLGITKKFVDRRDVHKLSNEGDKRCMLAQDMECYRIKKYIGAYLAALGHVDAIVFTAGLGEMNPQYRWKAISGLEAMGIKIDENKNTLSLTRNAETCISADDSPIKIFVIPTDEELVMTEDAHALMNGSYEAHMDFSYSFQSPQYRNSVRDTAFKEELKKNPALKTIVAEIP